MNFKKTIAVAAASVLAVSAMAATASAEKAGLTFQTNVYSFRDTPFQSQAIWWDEFNEAVNFDTWNVVDVDITEDGTYTVSFECDFASTEKGDAFWNMLKVTTNVDPAQYPDFVMTCDKLVVDGKEIASAAGAVSGESEGLKANQYADSDYEPVAAAYELALYNTYNSEQRIISSEDFGSKVECTFTVTGFKSAEAAPADTEAAAPSAGDTNTATPDKGNADTGVEGVAAVAGIAIIAAGAIVIAKKRK